MSIHFLHTAVLLAESPSSGFFLKVSWGAVLLAGFSFFLLGILAGWWIWGAYQGRSKSIEKRNSKLLRRQEEMENAFEEYRKKYSSSDTDREDNPTGQTTS